MKIKNTLLFCLLFCLTLLSCQKKVTDAAVQEKKLGSLKFTPSECNIIPYNTANSLVFKSNTTDSVVFLPNDESLHTSCYTESHLYPDSGNGNYYEYDEKFVKFGNKYLDNLFIQIFFTDPFTDTLVKKRIAITWTRDNFNSGYFFGEYCFAADTIYNDPDTTNVSIGTVKAFHPALVLGQKKYRHVYELAGVTEYPQYCVYVKTLYYTIREGIVGYSLNTGKLYFLNNVM
jgi:hypothetical protein